MKWENVLHIFVDNDLFKKIDLDIFEYNMTIQSPLKNSLKSLKIPLNSYNDKKSQKFIPNKIYFGVFSD